MTPSQGGKHVTPHPTPKMENMCATLLTHPPQVEDMWHPSNPPAVVVVAVAADVALAVVVADAADVALAVVAGQRHRRKNVFSFTKRRRSWPLFGHETRKLA